MGCYFPGYHYITDVEAYPTHIPEENGMGRLTVAAIEKLKVKGFTKQGKGKRKKQGGKERTRIEYHDGGGLYLIVQRSGHKSWALKFKKNGINAKLTLGPYDAKGSPGGTPQVGDPLNLVEARTLATAIKLQRNRGVDPIAERKAAMMKARLSSSPTGFAAAARGYIERRCRDDKKLRGWANIAATLGLSYQGDDAEPSLIKGGLCERWGDRPVAGINEDDCFAVIDESRYHGVPGRVVRNKGQSSSRQHGMACALGGMFRWLKGRRMVATNPVAGLERPEPHAARDRVLSDDELRAIWLASDELNSPFGTYIKVLMLTGQRRSEVAGMRRSELSIGFDTWTIPGSRTKNKQTHTVPLSEKVAALITTSDSESDLIFTTNGSTPISGMSKVKRRLDENIGSITSWRFHDLRRTMATMMCEIGVEPHVVEELLNHKSGHKGGVAGVYNRARYSEQKKVAMERWAARVEAIVSGEKIDNVTPLRA
jgi:integrase